MPKKVKKIALSSSLIFERYLWLVIKTLGTFLMIILSVYFFLISPAHVDGPSMEPTYFDGDDFFVNRFVYFLEKPVRYDIIQLINKEKTAHIIKRVIGLPGEVVIIEGGEVFVQSWTSFLTEKKEGMISLHEPYVHEYMLTRPYQRISSTAYVVKPGEYFVLGDNREESIDSRAYGTIPREHIIGKVID